ITGDKFIGKESEKTRIRGIKIWDFKVLIAMLKAEHAKLKESGGGFDLWYNLL
ncbi:unnamed protein product, partial [marine sediment metagenome]